MGSELWFYPDGSVSFNFGTLKEVSGNYAIDNPTITYSGTWSSMGGNGYNVKLSNPSEPSAPPTINIVYYYPQSTNPMYPGLTYPEHITVQQGTTTVVFDRTESDTPPSI